VKGALRPSNAKRLFINENASFLIVYIYENIFKQMLLRDICKNILFDITRH